MKNCLLGKVEQLGNIMHLLRRALRDYGVCVCVWCVCVCVCVCACACACACVCVCVCVCACACVCVCVCACACVCVCVCVCVMNGISGSKGLWFYRHYLQSSLHFREAVQHVLQLLSHDNHMIIKLMPSKMYTYILPESVSP